MRIRSIKMKQIILDLSFFIIFTLILSIGYRVKASFSCGPMLACTCTLNSANLTKVDCTNRRVTICQICKTVGQRVVQIVADNLIQYDILKQGCFVGCDRLEVLSLKDNTITAIQTDVFRATPQLQSLNLDSNSLSFSFSRNDSWMKWLKSLTHLQIKGYDVSQNVSYGYPDLSNSLKLVYLAMDGLPDTNFGKSYMKLIHLKVIDLSGDLTICRMNQLTNDTFKHLPPSVTTLNLSNCNIFNIYAGAFIGLHKLANLDLSYNRQLQFAPIRNISYGLQFTEIDVLNISYLHVTFGLGTILRKRDLCYFRNTTMRVVNVDGNKIQLFETNSILLLPTTLQTIRTNDNTFSFGPYLLQMACLDNVTDVHGNLQHHNHSPLKYPHEPIGNAFFIESSIDDCPFMSNDYLRNITKNIDNCPFFETDKLSERDLQKAAVPPKLKTVTCISCDIQSMIQRYPVFPVPRVSYLDISDNIFDTWIGPVGPFPYLTVANLSKNYCSYIGPDFFFYAYQLEVLNIANNFLGIPFRKDTTGTIFRTLTKLKHLNVSSNQIQYLPPKIFQHLHSLEELDIKMNSLDKLEIDVSSMINLTKLIISYNALQRLPINVMFHLERTSERRQRPFEIDMGHNTIIVKCENKDFLEWMVKHKDSFVDFSRYNFTNGDQQKLTEEEFVRAVFNLNKLCRTYTVAIVLTTLGISVFLSIVIGGVICKNRWKLRYFLYMNKRRFYGYRALPNYEPIENYKYDAFISYTEENMPFIINKLIPVLEKNSRYSLCIHQRDFVAGNAVTDNIVNAIQSSRKTLLILTKDYLKSKWCIYEFHMARMESIYSRDGKGCLAIVMLEDVPISDEMPLEMIQWIKQKSYIEYTTDEEGEIVFWEKLREAIED